MKRVVSVLITFYNQKEYVNTALSSVMSQETDFDFEVLIGDDGSSDGTVEEIQKWVEKYPNQIRIVSNNYSDKNIPGGFRASRNRINLLKNVMGEYFIFLDGDDYWDNNHKLQRQVDILDNPANLSCVACGHLIDMLYEDGTKKTWTNKGLQEGHISLKKYWTKFYVHTDTLLVRSSVISKLPLQLLENNFNDNMITFSILQHGDLYYIPESMAVYLQTGDGIWTANNIIVNNIRNLFLCDFAIAINPYLKQVSLKRMSYSWHILYLNRGEIDINELKIYLVEAEDKHLEYSLSWIRYNQLSDSEKRRLKRTANRLGWKYIPGEVYRALKKR